MSSPIRSKQIQADRANRVQYQQALEEEKLADPAYQARLEQAREQSRIDRQERKAYQEQRSRDFKANWEARFRENFPNAPIPGSAEAKAFNPITLSRAAGVMKPLAEVRNQAYQNTGTLPPNTQLLMPNGAIRPITSVYPEYMNTQMQKVSEEIFDYYRGAHDRAKAGAAAYKAAWKPANDTGLSFRETIEKQIADSFAKHGMGQPKPLFGSDLTWARNAIAGKAAPILAKTADVRARHREPRFMSSLGGSPQRMSMGYKDGGLGSYPYTRPHTHL